MACTTVQNWHTLPNLIRWNIQRRIYLQSAYNVQSSSNFDILSCNGLRRTYSQHNHNVWVSPIRCRCHWICNYVTIVASSNSHFYKCTYYTRDYNPSLFHLCNVSTCMCRIHAPQKSKPEAIQSWTSVIFFRNLTNPLQWKYSHSNKWNSSSSDTSGY